MSEDRKPPFPDLEAATAETLSRFTLDRNRAEQLIAQLGEAPYLRLKGLVRKLAATEPWPVAAALLKLAKRIADARPKQATEMARLALMTARRAKLPARFAQSLYAEAEALMGDGWRRLRKFHDAERAFARAARHLDRACDPNQSAVYCCLLANLREEQNRGEEALALRARAASLFEEVGQIDDQAQALLDKATLELDRDEADGALSDLREVITLADRGLRPDLAAMAVAAYGTILCKLHRTAEALAVLHAFRERYPGFDNPFLLAELDLLEGDMLIFSDRQEVAEARLEAARREFFALGDDRKAAFASLSLALLYLLDGRRGPDLKRLVKTSIEPLSRSPKLPAVAHMPLRRFAAAIGDRTATAALAGAIREHIASLRTLPDDDSSAAGVAS